jgi:hypothetical protein
MIIIMDQTLTFLKLAEIVLEKKRTPLTHKEIWDEAVKYGLDKKLDTNAKKTWISIRPKLYLDIRDNSNSVFYQYSKHPTKFF